MLNTTSPCRDRQVIRVRLQLAGLLCLALMGPAQLLAVDLVGYLPYYRMNSSYNTNTLPAQLSMLDEVRYFGLTVDFSGNIVPLGSGSGSLSNHLSRIATIRETIATLPVDEQPRLNITLGGAGEAANFATVAASATLRDSLAANVESLLDQTMAESVDIDWEHPAAGIQRSTHYPALLQRIKQQVGAERRVHATVAPSVVISNSVFAGEHAIDGVALMTYDLGWWGNDPANPNTGEHSLPEYVIDASNAWTEAPGSPNDRPWVFGNWGNSAPADKLGVALPFYGRNVSNGVAYTYAELVAGGTTSDGNYYSYAGGNVWAVDPDMAAERVQYAHDNGLQSIIIWEIGQDLSPTNPDSLLRAAYERSKLLTAKPGDYDGDGTIGTGDYALWKSTLGNSIDGDLRADGNGNNTVDLADYTVWRDQRDLTMLDWPASQAIPEPATAKIAALLVCLTLLVKKPAAVSLRRA